MFAQATPLAMPPTKCLRGHSEKPADYRQIIAAREKPRACQRHGAALANSGDMQSEQPDADDHDPDDPNAPRADDQPRIIPAEELFAGRREIWIQHGDQRYRLRITAAGKLILTK
jgi:hemin uptake protein HemP